MDDPISNPDKVIFYENDCPKDQGVSLEVNTQNGIPNCSPPCFRVQVEVDGQVMAIYLGYKDAATLAKYLERASARKTHYINL
jgi:hypothetical protein